MPFKGTVANGCRPDARLIVGDTEIPYCNEGITTHVRKDGPADITRESTCVIPMTWGDHDDEDANNVADVVNGLSGGTPRRQHASVELLDPYETTNDEPVYRPIHHGYIAAAGGHADRGAARFRIADFAQLFDVPASVTFEQGASIRSVLEYVRRRLIDGQSVIDDLSFAVKNIAQDTAIVDDTIDVDDVGGDADAVEAFLNGEIIAEEDLATEGNLDAAGETFRSEVSQTVGKPLNDLLGFTDFDVIDFPKSFSADRDTLADVMRWIDKFHNVHWYFEPRPATATPRLVLDGNPTVDTFHDENHLDGESNSQGIRILENNALYQLNPPHRLTARGRSASLLETPPTWLTQEGGPNKFPIATATYDELDAQTDVEEAPITIEVDAFTTAEAESVARSELKDRLNGSAGGEMTLPPTPYLRPYAEIDALPVCGSETVSELPAISYEAEEVVHYVTTSGTNSEPSSPRTVVRCGIFVDPTEITIVETSYHDA